MSPVTNSHMVSPCPIYPVAVAADLCPPGASLPARLSISPAICGLPLALGCWGLRRLGYRSGVWTAGVALGAVTLPTGLLEPLVIEVCALAISVPVWND